MKKKGEKKHHRQKIQFAFRLYWLRYFTRQKRKTASNYD